jgi:hypothetical protein
MIVQRALADADFGRDGVDADRANSLQIEQPIRGFQNPGIFAAVRRRADRAIHGFRAIMVAGALLYVAGLALMAGANGFLSVMIGGGVLIGASLACTAAAIAMSVAARAVPVSVRSTVLGLVSGAGSLGCRRRLGRYSTRATAGEWGSLALWCCRS